LWVPNGPVVSIVKSGNTLYLGGGFNFVGPKMPFAAQISTGTGVVNLSMPAANRNVTIAIPDGAGGWYIGGEFTTIGGVSRDYIARINADGSLNAWNPGANDIVNALAKYNGVIYAGGNFTHIGGQTRNRVAAIDSATGAVTSWNPSLNSAITSLVVDGNSLFVSGYFSSINGVSHSRVASFSLPSGTLTSLNPSINSGLDNIAVYNNVLYVMGGFTTVGGQPRNYVAALDPATGQVASWNPNPNNYVRNVIVNGGTAYLGGDFTTVGGQARNRLAATDVVAGALTAWTANVGNIVYDIELIGNELFVSGQFTTAGGQSRNNLAAFDITTGALSSWNPSAGGEVFRLASSGNNIFAVGNFQNMGGVKRDNIVAIDLTTGEPTSWNPNINDQVFAIAVDGNTIYAGGSFTSVGGVARNRIAGIDAVTGLPSAWNPGADHIVFALAVGANDVFAGGGFNNTGQQPRNGLAAINKTTGISSSWNAAMTSGSFVSCLTLSGSNLYVGGGFLTIGGQPRIGFGVLDINTALATSFNPQINGGVDALALQGNILYLGGNFSTVGGQTRNNIASVNATTGAVTAFNPNADYGVKSIAADATNVFAGGEFENIGGLPRNRLAKLDPATGAVAAWNPDMESSVFSLLLDNNSLYAGGYFLASGPNAAPCLAYFSLSGPEISISASSNNVCAGTPITFTTSILNGGNSPQYQWRRNGSIIPGATNSTYATSLLSDGDQIDCILTSSDAGNPTVTSSAITMNISSGVTPTISISTPNPVVTAGDQITFSASITHGGISPTYQWKVNGNPAGINASTFITSTLANGSVVSCELTSNLSCVSTANAVSNNITMTVLSCEATITASGLTTICYGGNVTLTANPGAGYFWSNGLTTQSITATQPGSYKVTVSNGAGCSVQSAATQVVVKSLPNAIKIKVSGPAAVCEPATVLLVMDMLPGATTGFAYQWNLDGTPIGGATDSFYVAALSGDYPLTVYSGTCSKTSSVKNAKIKTRPAASFSASGPLSFCEGGSVTLSANVVSGYTYAWLSNSAPAGSGSSKNFKNTGTYTVIAKLNGCSDTASLAANVTVHPLPVASIATGDPTIICAGEGVTLEATPFVSGYISEWYNGSAPVDTTADGIFEATLAGNYKVVVTDNNGCVSKKSATAVKVKVSSVPDPTITALGPTTIPTGGNVKLKVSPSSGVTMQWYKDGVFIPGATNSSYIVTAGGDYTAAVSKNLCTGVSAATTVVQTPIREERGTTSTVSEASGFEIVAYPNPVNGLLTVGIKGIEDIDAIVYLADVHGRMIMQKEMHQATLEIDMQEYASGAYFILYRDVAGRTGTVKVVRE
jgi:hypothetical protein